MFAGGFFDCDWYGNFFGQRTQVRDVKEDGTGRLINGATIYTASRMKSSRITMRRVLTADIVRSALVSGLAMFSSQATMCLSMARLSP